MSDIRIAVIGHANVHERQQRFFKDLAKFHSDLSIFVLGPRMWGNHIMNDEQYANYRQKGLPCSNRNMIDLYVLLAINDYLKDFKPHIIYAQTELWSKQAAITLGLVEKYKSKLVYFIWENIRPLTNREYQILQYPKIVICGNNDAKNIIMSRGYTNIEVLPQVGIDTSIFRPIEGIKKEFEVLYAGRMVPEKGTEYITRTCANLGITFNSVNSLKYTDMPIEYNKARIFCSFPFDTPLWKEQSGSYTNLEAMACGIPVVTSDCGAIPEYIEGSAMICRQKNETQLRQTIFELLTNKEERTRLGELGFDLIQKKFSNEVIGNKLYNLFKSLINETELLLEKV